MVKQLNLPIWQNLKQNFTRTEPNLISFIEHEKLNTV